MTTRARGLGLSECRSLHVVARFASRRSVELDADWPVLLDGVLASVAPRPAKPTEVVPLPLAHHKAGVGAQWCWLASVGLPIGADSPEWAYRWRGDEDTVVVECAGVEWHAVGDAGRVRGLLAGVGRIGNRNRRCEVQRWDVVDAGPAPECSTEALWLPCGLIARPVAARAATVLGVPGAETVDGTVRPPYWRAPPNTDGGTFERAWRPVLAPWTRRP